MPSFNNTRNYNTMIEFFFPSNWNIEHIASFMCYHNYEWNFKVYSNTVHIFVTL